MLIDNLKQKLCIIENVGENYPGPLSAKSTVLSDAQIVINKLLGYRLIASLSI